MNVRDKNIKGLFVRAFYSIIFSVVSVFTFAQNEAGCLNSSQLHAISRGNLVDVNAIMNREGWMLLSNEDEEKLFLGADTIDYHLAIWKQMTTFKESYLYVYYKENRKNYVEWQTEQSCYEMLFQKIDELHGEKRTENLSGTMMENSFPLPSGETIVFKKRLTGEQEHVIIYYDKQELDSLIVLSREDRFKKEEERRWKRERIEFAIKRSDDLLRAGRLDDALTMLDTLSVMLPGYKLQVEKKQQHLRDEIRLKKIADLTIEGERLFTERALNSARHKFQEVLLLDPYNQMALTRVEQINRMLEVLTSRSSTIYDYAILNPDAYKSVHDLLSAEINRITRATPDGRIQFNFAIFFDTLGQNRSFYDVKESTNPSFNTFLRQLSNNGVLKPTYKSDILVSSRSLFEAEIRWSTMGVEMKKTRKKIKTIGQMGLVRQSDKMTHFLEDSLMPKGKYQFTVKNKELIPVETFSDVKLVKYKTVGPEAMFYSMLLPGSGTMAATQGQKGVGALLSFLIFGAATLTSFYYSRDQAKKAETYQNQGGEDFDPAVYRKYQKNSDILKYCTYAGAGISGVIYISDIINAFSKGVKNKKQSKELRKALKKSPIDISNENIIL